MILSSIEKRKNKIFLIFDNAEKIELFYDVYLYFPIYKGDEVNADKIEEMLNVNAEYEIKSSAFRYLANRNHSTLELKRKLRKKEYNPELIEKVLEELKEKNYLNDFRFAEGFVKNRLERRKEGLQKITSALYSKGIDREIINEVIAAVSENPVILENAFSLAQKKMEQLKTRKETDLRKVKSKIFNFLRGRGFSNDIIFKVLNSIESI